jgi:hypothetical protein
VKSGTVRYNDFEFWAFDGFAAGPSDLAAAGVTGIATTAGAASDAPATVTSAGDGAVRVPGGTESGPVAAARAAVVRSAKST